jgi:flagellar hook-associated protein 3 FlgL
MLPVFDPTTEQFLSSLAQTQKSSSQAMEQISTGRRVNQPSDAPEDVVAILHIQGQVSSGTQVQTNLGRLKNEVDSAESTIETALNILDQASVFAAQGMGVMQTPATRAGIAMQVKDLQQQLVGLTQLNVQGKFVFSGDQDQQAQYAYDPTNTTTGVTQNFVATQTTQSTDVLGSTFSSALTAEQLFDHRNNDATRTAASDNVFAALEQLQQGLANNDTTMIGQAVSALKDASAWLNSNLAFYGGVQNRISSSLAVASKYQLQWQQELSDKRDADYAQSITSLESSRTNESAALSARAKFGPQSLFDYLR